MYFLTLETLPKWRQEIFKELPNALNCVSFVTEYFATILDENSLPLVIRLIYFHEIFLSMQLTNYTRKNYANGLQTFILRYNR